MDKYRVSLVVQVVVEANSPQQAERIAFERGDELKRTGHVSASMHATKESR
jgi:hypothetical protein